MNPKPAKPLPLDKCPHVKEGYGVYVIIQWPDRRIAVCVNCGTDIERLHRLIEAK